MLTGYKKVTWEGELEMGSVTNLFPGRAEEACVHKRYPASFGVPGSAQFCARTHIFFKCHTLAFE